MHHSALNYGYYAQGYKRLSTGELVEALGSAGVRHFDQRWGLCRMADEALAWARREGHEAYQLRRTFSGYRQSRAQGCVMFVGKEKQA